MESGEDEAWHWIGIGDIRVDTLILMWREINTGMYTYRKRCAHSSLTS